MQFYRHSGSNTGVARFEIRENSITIEFKDGSIYLYNQTRPGRRHVDAMKKRALAGKGLTTYINQHVRDRYAEKLN